MTKLALVATLAVAMLSSLPVLPANAQRDANYPCTSNQCEGQSTPEPDCGGQLGVLKRVYPAEVSGINNRSRVWITEFCMSSSLMRADGNAAYLRTAIAKNKVLTDMLTSRGYNANDVFAVKMMGDDTINLYVHDFAN